MFSRVAASSRWKASDPGKSPTGDSSAAARSASTCLGFRKNRGASPAPGLGLGDFLSFLLGREEGCHHPKSGSRLRPMPVTLTVNGQKRTTPAGRDAPLLYVLRNDFELN